MKPTEQHREYVMTFDTLAASKRLQAAGISEAHADAYVGLLQEVLTAQERTLASKTDLAVLHREIQLELETFRGEIRTELKAFQGEIRTELKAFQGEIRTELETLRGEVFTEIANVRTEMQGIRADFADRFGRVEGRIGGLEGRIGRVEGQLTVMTRLMWVMATFMIGLFGLAIKQAFFP
ncbi:MAG: hypothetical protein ETSY1_35020 [Candidatus Entotheonella factor]|uniref:DUF1640 domain-containing protein n=1 Tax=Entotheonella factor TaxID=1429438 RepID=W4LAR4_ENTF1|nr:MAG: hypothetical protein ETSY1_35020 [Candidatus Entotheonella factor]